MSKTWTRKELAQLLGVPTTTIRTWERSGAGRPTDPAKFQNWDQAKYSASDVACFRVIAHASRIGLRGSRLATIWQQLHPLTRYVSPGWSGIAVTTTQPDAWLIGDDVPGPASVEDLMRTLPSGIEVCTVSLMEVPE